MTDYLAQFDDYCKKVLSGEYPSGRLVQLAVKRHLIDIETADERGLMWDEGKAQAACEFVSMLKHTRGVYSGTPFIPKAFQVFVICSLFGWQKWDGEAFKPDKGGVMQPAAGYYRRFREALITMGKGGGKSPLAAALSLYTTFAAGGNRAQGFIFATGLDQAKQLFDEACCLAASNPTLARLTKPYKESISGPNGCEIKAMCTQSKIDGYVPQFQVMDEIHRWDEYNRKTYDVLKASLGKSPDSLLLKITTAGDENSHILRDELDTLDRVLSQAEVPPSCWFGDEQFGFIAEVDKGDDIYDERNWPKANPMLLEPGGPVQIKHLRAMAEKAQAGDVNAEITFRRLHCNQQVSSLNKPIRPEAWALGNKPLPTNLESYECWGAFDLARTNDFCAAALVWKLEDDQFGLKAWGWTVEDRNETLRSTEFLKVLQSPNVFVHEGNQVEYRHVREYIGQKLNLRYNPTSWAFDPNWANETSQELYADYGIDCIEHPQTAKHYNEPLTKFLEAVNAGRIIHGGCPLLAWCAGNLVVRTNQQGLQMPAKDKSVNKIDPIVASLMAFREMLFGDPAPMPHIY